MANFDEILQKTGETAEILAGKTVQLAKATAVKTKKVARIAKLNTEILGEKETMRKAYIELGKAFYERFLEAPPEELVRLFETISISTDKIRTANEKIAEIKNGFKTSNEFCGAETNDFGSDNSDDCDNC